MINIFLLEFRTLESKIVGDREAVDKLYMLLEIAILVVTVLKNAVLWYRNRVMISYLEVFYGFQKRDGMWLQKKTLDAINQLNQILDVEEDQVDLLSLGDVAEENNSEGESRRKFERENDKGSEIVLSNRRRRLVSPIRIAEPLVTIMVALISFFAIIFMDRGIE